MVVKRVLRWALRKLRKLRSDKPVVIPRISEEVDGIDVFGFFTSEHGVGEAARVITATLRSASVLVSTIDYGDTQSRKQHKYECDNVSRYNVLLASVNSDQLKSAYSLISSEFFSEKYVIGQWFWELEEAPPWFADAYPLVDELWAPTQFIANMLQRNVPSKIRVEHVPLPIVTPIIDTQLSRTRFGLDNRFMFLFVFDFMSVMKRKNPLGLIKAFHEAFAEGEGPQLVIKTINGDKRPEEFTTLYELSMQRTDTVLIDEYFTRLETSTLISLADCYVSVHRSEGLGLTITEAMSLGVPVIASGYSGNLDFMTADNSVLISGELIPVGDGAEGYASEAYWFDPKISETSANMRYVFENQQFAQEMGKRGQSDILSSLTIERCGAIMKSRLEEIWSSERGN